MKKIKMYFFKVGRKISLFRKKNRGIFSGKILNADDGNARIATLLSNENPCLIAKIGSSEMQAINETICVDLGIKKEINQKVKDILYTNAGFSPDSDSAVKKFTDIYCDGGKKINLLAVLGNSDDDFFIEEYCKDAELTNLCALNPYYHSFP